MLKKNTYLRNSEERYYFSVFKAILCIIFKLCKAIFSLGSMLN